jgi:hypothetical protein
MTTRLSIFYSGIQLVLAIALIAWGIMYGYEDYQGDQCSQAFDAHAKTDQIRIKNVQARLDKNQTRAAVLQARAGEVASKLNGLGKDGK